MSPETRSIPHSPEIEEYLLGCCLIDGGPTFHQAVSAGITAESFYTQTARLVWEAMGDLAADSKPLDAVLLAEALRAKNHAETAGGYAYLAQLSARIPTTAQAPHFIDQLRELAQLRELIRRATALIENCYSFSGSLEDEIVPGIQRLNNALRPRQNGRSWKEAVDDAEAATRERMKPPEQRSTIVAEVPWGIEDFDRVFQPVELGELVVIGGATSSGKSSLLRQALWGMARAGDGTFSATLETQDSEEAVNLAGHIAGHRSRARLHQLHAKDQAELLKAFQMIRGTKGYQVTHLAHSLDAIFAEARLIKARRDLKVVGIDYLQILADTKNLRPGERPDFATGVATSKAKRFATETGIAVILLSGFNRDYIRAGNRPPRLSDLDGSGSIEKDASRVLLIDVPTEYELQGSRCTQNPSSDPTDQPRLYVNIFQAKGRNQGTASIGMYFRRETKTFAGLGTERNDKEDTDQSRFL